MGGVGTWRNFTSMKDVKSIARSGHSYWAATSGGLFRWDEVTGSYLKLTSAEGLLSTDLTAVAIDAHGDVWACASTGMIHIYTPTSGVLRTIANIVDFPGPTDKSINAIVASGDTVLLCSDFGLSVYRIDKGEFGDTFTSFGGISPNNRVKVFSALISGGQFWAALTDGSTGNYIARADLSRPNLLDPQAWTLQQAGPAGSVPVALASFKGRLYAGTTTGLYRWNGASWDSLKTLSGASIVALDGSGPALEACTAAGTVYTVDTTGAATVFGAPLSYTPTSIVAGSTGGPAVGTLSGGIQTYASSWSAHFPNGPNANEFNDLCFAPDGTLWCAGGGFYGTGTGFGFYRYNGTTWQSFTPANSLLPDDEVYLVSVGCDGSVWASLYGFGIVQMPSGTSTIDSAHIFRTNAGFVGIPANLNFIVPGNVVCDAHGNLWTTIVASADGRILGVRTPAGAWRHVPVYVNGIKASTLQDRPVNRCLAVDASDNLWACVKDPALKGVIALANGGTIDSVAAVHINGSNGLPSDNASTIVVDRDNEIWVGTDRGIAIILDPSNPLRSGAIATYRPANGLTVNAIAVDPLNQKWVATSEGVILYTPDGTQALASYTVESTNGKLIDDDVKSIAVDPSTGTVYFGTTGGLAALTTDAVAPKAQFGKLSVYPNPYIVPNASTLTVDGLVANSSIKILTIDGRLVREIKTSGGRVGFWDGRDDQGNVVASGVYIIAGFTEDGSQAGTGKVAVIRH
ncbi:MAG TPA: two-component regulator propeller domain-containing protein [Bacteroidota bacterium]|nr:two-component regulator propeller domain-containing protein [Bacteroidota bacterium]